MNKQEINKARAIYYKLFSSFFVYKTDVNSYFELINQIELLKNNALDESSASAFSNLEKKLQKDSNIELLKEYDNIFHNPQTKTIRTTASYYDEGVETGLKRVQMLDFLAKTKLRRDEKSFFEYEDTIGFIFVVLSQLAFYVSEGEENYENLQHCIFKEVLNEFVDEISQEIYEHEYANIYKDVIVALLSFMEFERLYLEVSRAKKKEKKEIKTLQEDEISQEERERRARNKALREQGPKKTEEPFVASSVEDI